MPIKYLGSQIGAVVNKKGESRNGRFARTENTGRNYEQVRSPHDSDLQLENEL